jgi:hypothetical protein
MPKRKIERKNGSFSEVDNQPLPSEIELNKQNNSLAIKQNIKAEKSKSSTTKK